jgi:cell division transport system permease protein
MVMDSIPIPGLISVTFKKNTTTDLVSLENELKTVAPRARIDTHESWLSDVVRFTGALQFAAFLLTLIIGITTLVAVAGAVRSKLAENKEELELLHLMGASDSYIAKQLQRHTLILSLQGGGLGILAGALMLFLISLVAGEMGVNLVPDFKLDGFQKILLFLMPLPIAALAMVTTRFTVLRVLTKMP